MVLVDWLVLEVELEVEEVEVVNEAVVEVD